MAKETGFIEVGDGQRLAWQASGDGPAVLLIHGGSIDSRMWQPQVEDLAADYRVISYDFRGFGGSTRPTGRYRMSDDALTVLDELGVRTAAIVGFSIGSRIALDIAARAPERVAAVALSGVMPWNDAAAERYAAARRKLAELLQPRQEAQRRGDLAGAVAGDLDVWATAHHGRAREALTEMCMQAPYFFEHRESDDEWYGDLPPVDDGALTTLPAPGLVIVGEHDVEAARLASAGVAEVLRDGELLVVADADHFVSLGRPEVFNTALRALLDRRRAQGGW